MTSPTTTTAITTTAVSGGETPPSSRPPQLLREDCWSPEESRALIEAWGSHHLALSRGSLRQHQWMEVSAAVNSAGDGKARRSWTHVQCKNRIDTLKKKYKSEKAKTVDSGGNYVSPWPLFARLDFLVSGGPTPEKVSPAPGRGSPAPLSGSPAVVTPALTNFPVGRRSAIPKRPATRFPIVAGMGSDDDEEVGEGYRRRWVRKGPVRRFEVVAGGKGEGYRRLAEAIRRFGEVYERVESMKQEQMMELERHRMEFVKDMECQRMRLLMDTQMKLAKIKRSKLSYDHADPYL